MKLATKIFKRSDWYVTSKFGWRIHPITKKKSFHNGCDYGTNVQKWPQYAIEDGYVNEVVISKAKTGYGTYIWVRYPRINRSLLHAHLDSVVVKKGDKVKEGTLLGYTGKTGSATGIHLHLGMTEIGKHTWLDPDAYDYQPEPKEEKPKEEKPKNEFKVGDKVVPTVLKDYNGKRLVQYDKYYYITSLKGNRAVCSAKRNNKYIVWAAMNIKNLKHYNG